MMMDGWSRRILHVVRELFLIWNELTHQGTVQASQWILILVQSFRHDDLVYCKQEMQDISSNILRYVIDLHFKVLTKNDMIFFYWLASKSEGGVWQTIHQFVYDCLVKGKTMVERSYHLLRNCCNNFYLLQQMFHILG